MVRKHHNAMLAMAIAGIALLAVKPLIKPVPLVIWNASESVPIGWYFVAKRQPKIDEIAIIKPADWLRIYAAERGYLPKNVWLLKPIYAVHPSIICRFGSYVFVDGKHVVRAKIADKMHRALPVWRGCNALSSTQYFVLGRHRDSFDSRYFGPIEKRQVVGTAFRKRPVPAPILHPALPEQIAHSQVEENEQWRADILKVKRGRVFGLSMLRRGGGAS